MTTAAFVLIVTGAVSLIRAGRRRQDAARAAPRDRTAGAFVLAGWVGLAAAVVGWVAYRGPERGAVEALAIVGCVGIAVVLVGVQAAAPAREALRPGARPAGVVQGGDDVSEVRP